MPPLLERVPLMAPRVKQVDNPNAWWEGAYSASPHIEVEYEIDFNGDQIVPLTKIKIKNKRGEFKFRCRATNTQTGRVWIDCLDATSGEWRSFYADQIRNVVKPKRRRKRTVRNEKV